jgi:hypothetical protein
MPQWQRKEHHQLAIITALTNWWRLEGRRANDTDDDGDGNEKKTIDKRQKSPVKSKYLVPLLKVALTE